MRRIVYRNQMKIFVTAKPNAKEAKIEKLNESHFEVWVTEPPHDGRANEAIIRSLAEYFVVAPSNIHIVSGLKSKQKILEIKT